MISLGLLASVFIQMGQTPVTEPDRISEPSCADLRAYTDRSVTVLKVQDVGGDKPYCRIDGVVTPVAGSRIGFALFLPAHAEWNGRLKMLGNGGYSSSIPEEQLKALAAEGYVSVATDTGHKGDDPDFAVGYPEALIDWSHRAVHETSRAAKGITESYYGAAPDWSYFEGCSTGGHQAFSEVQRYPDDFDGVIAGAPGHNRVRLNAAFLNQFLVNRQPDDPSQSVLTPASLRLIANASHDACDTNPATPYIDDPLACEFDPVVLACTSENLSGGACLSPLQVEVARAMYDGTRDPETGELIYPPWLPGSEAGGPVPDIFPGWSLYWADPQFGDVPARQSFWRFWVFNNPSWTFAMADLAQDVPFALEKLGDIVDATDPDLSAFQAAGGKLLHYHGLADPVVSPHDSIQYHEQVTELLGEGTADFYRLFLLPGVEHCGGGSGPSDFDRQAIIEAWVEQDIAPKSLNVSQTGESDTITLELAPYNGKESGD